MTMRLPPHPGLSVRHDCLEPLGLSVTEAARVLGLSRQALNNVVNGKAAISADMAIRLDRAFGGGAEVWLRLQMAHDLAQARERNSHAAIRRYRSSAPAGSTRPGATREDAANAAGRARGTRSKTR